MLGIGLWAALWGVEVGSPSVAAANEPTRGVPYPPLRNAMQRASWLGAAGDSASAATGASASLPSPAQPVEAVASPSTPSPSGPSGSGLLGATLADSRWCGIEPPSSQPEPMVSCKLTTLPCGPVSPDRIFSNSGEETDDLDGDGLRDLVVGGRVSVQSKEVFAAIYRDRKSTRLNSSHTDISRMPSSA